MKSMRTSEVLEWTAIIVAVITFFGTILSALIPKLWDYFMGGDNRDDDVEGA